MCPARRIERFGVGPANPRLLPPHPVRICGALPSSSFPESWQRKGRLHSHLARGARPTLAMAGLGPFGMTLAPPLKASPWPTPPLPLPAGPPPKRAPPGRPPPPPPQTPPPPPPPPPP